MKNTAGVRHYFVEAFTPSGYISMLQELFEELKYIYIITGGPGSGKATMIKLIGVQLLDRGYDVDYIRSLREPDSVAGLYLPKQRLGLIDEEEFEPLVITKKEGFKRINLELFCDPKRLQEYENRINKLSKDIAIIEQEIIEQLQEDYPLENKTEKVFLSLKALLDTQVDDIPAERNKVAEVLSKVKKDCLSYYFLHALQPGGWLNLAPGFIGDYDRICLEEGDTSSNLLLDILQEVRHLGQVIEIIISPLQPHGILGLVFPEKKLTVWKGNPCNIEEQGFKKQHSPKMQAILEKYKTLRADLKNLWNDTVNFRQLDELRNQILSSILSDLQEHFD
ncbi:MAG: hypothetical protein ACOX7U_05180 [Desulfitobacteriia bacterium]